MTKSENPLEDKVIQLEALNIDGRLKQLEDMYGNFMREVNAQLCRASQASVIFERFKSVEKKLIERMKAIEAVLGKFCLFTYELGFFTPDNKKERELINKLEEELRLKDMRLKEIEDVLGSLKKRK